MAWASTDLANICKYLGIEILPNKNSIQVRLDRLTEISPESVTIVQADLAELATLEASIAAKASKDGLKKAGDLEWFAMGSQTGAYKIRQQQLIQRIIVALDLDGFVSSTGGCLYRS